MKATLIYGYEGSGKSGFVYEMCKKARYPGAKSVFIVPDQYTHQTELDIIAAFGSCGLTDTEVFSFKRLSHRLKLLYGGASVIMLTNESKHMLVNAIINRSRDDNDNALLKNSAVTDITGDMAQLISRLKQYGVSPEMLENCNIDPVRYSHTKSKLNEVAKVYREYINLSQSTESAFFDTEDDMELLCKNIAENNAFADTDVYIDGFDDLARPELKVLQELIKHAKSVTITLPCEQDVKLNRGLLFYRQKKMIHDVERAVYECGVVPQRISISDNVAHGTDDITVVPARHRPSKEIDFIEANIFSAHVYDGEVNNVVLYKEQSVRDEVEHTADRILSLVRDKDYRFNDIAIVCGDAEKYSRYFAKAFADRDIPYFMDVKRSIRSNAIIAFVIGLLDVEYKNRSTDSILSFLRSGLIVSGYDSDEDMPFKFEDITYLEKYCSAYYIKNRDWDSPFKYGASFYDLDRLNTVRESVMRYITPFEDAMRSAETAREYSAALEAYLSEMQINDIVDKRITYLIENGKNDIASEYSAVWNTLSEMLNQITVFMNDAMMSHEEFEEIFKKAFENATVNIIPVCIDQVTVLERSRTMAKHVRALFIVGAECIGVSEESGIFNMSELDMLKQNDIDIGTDKNNGIGDIQYYIYKTLSKPTDLLLVSSTMSSDADDNDPKSSLLTDSLKGLFGKGIREISSRRMPYTLSMADNRASAENAMLFRRTTLEHKYINCKQVIWLDETLRQNGSDRYSILADVVEKSVNSSFNSVDANIDSNIMLKSKNGVYSVDSSRLERYANCPYAYFSRYCLNIRSDGRAKVSPIDIGNIVHDMLEGFSKEVLSRDESTEAMVKVYVDENFDRIASEYQNGKISVTNENLYILRRVKNVLLQLMTIMLKRKAHGDTRVYANELTFDDNKVQYGGIPSVACEDKQGTPFNITGKIDNVEYAELDGKRYWIINDYKTGYKPKNREISHSKSLQLPIYMLAMLEQDSLSEPGAMFYVNVNDDILKMDSKGDIDDIVERRCGKTGIVADIEELMCAIDSEGINTKTNKPDLIYSKMIFNKDSLAKTDIASMRCMIGNARNRAGDIFCDIKNGIIDKKPLSTAACDKCEYRRLCGYVRDYSSDDDNNETDGGDE